MDSGLSLQTYIEADEMTRRRMTFEILLHLKDRLDQQPAFCVKQMDRCEKRMDSQGADIKQLKNDRVKNAAKATGGGIIGGFLAVLVKWIVGGNP